MTVALLRCRAEVGACAPLISAEPRPPSAALCMPMEVPGPAFGMEDGVEGALQEPQGFLGALGVVAVSAGAAVEATLEPGAAAAIAGCAVDVESAARKRSGSS